MENSAESDKEKKNIRDMPEEKINCLSIWIIVKTLQKLAHERKKNKANQEVNRRT